MAMKDMRAVRFNEKVKRLSTLFSAAGLAFILTAITRWLDRGADFSTLAWNLTGAAFIFVSVQMNDLLESEDEP